MRTSLPSFAKFILICCLTFLAMSSAFGVTPTAAGFTTPPPNTVSVNMEGCRNDGTLGSTTTFPVIIGGIPYYICPDSFYTNGNLDKNWAELDNVPFRLIITDKSSGSTPLSYNVVIAGDNVDVQNGTQHTGYFVVSLPEPDPGCPGGCLATPPTDPSCQVSDASGGQQIVQGITGGTFTTIYHTLTITQNPGTSCVFDYYQTLAIGSHLFNGSNLQAYHFETVDFSQGKETVSLPVNPCTNNNPQCVPSPAPQSLSKTMDASQNQENVWTVSKNAPAKESFNSCDLNDTSKNLSIVLTWTKAPGTQSQITITTKVYETNPSLVPLTVNVTDTIYATAIQGGAKTQVGTASATNVTVPANSKTLVLQDSATIDPTIYTTPYSDNASADVYDGGMLVGSLTASACLDPTNNQCTGVLSQGPGIDNSADITDTESISDTANALTFSVQDTVPSSLGSFTYNNSPYLLPGSAVTGPVLFDSGSQSASGSIQFDKTIYLSPAGTATTGDLTDTATATASDTSTQTNDSADVKITSAPVTKLTINKTLDATVGTDQTFTFDVFDASKAKVATASVTIKAGQTSGSIDVTTLAPGTYTVTEETPGAPWQPLPSQQVTLSTDNLCTSSVEFDNKHAQDLTVTKTAVPSLTRTYNWTISKSVDHTSFEQLNGSVTANYSVTATETGYTDSNWAVTGKITVTNPNSEDFTGVDVTDAINDANATCTVTNGTGLTVKANDFVTVDYSCTYSAAPATNSETNTATASWDNTSYGAPDSSAQGTAGVDFSKVTPTKVNDTITVQDTFQGTTTTLGTLTANDGPTFTTHTYNYSHTLAVPATACTTYKNTATVVAGTTTIATSAEVDVKVCTVSKSGALTMGFWQNKNGQGIIAASGPKTGTCALTTWLRQLTPFQDLSATAACGKVGDTSTSTVVGYVYTVIKNANAGGAAMNAMLKAQMLATALDVYFGGGPGGDPISAYNGGIKTVIGALAIDLTKVCNMIDSSSGTGTCTGVPQYINTSDAFVPLTCTSSPNSTVSNLLGKASSFDTVPGGLSGWYLVNGTQSKTLQGHAKNTFDAINNQAAFLCQ
jgi:hypothetical protein